MTTANRVAEKPYRSILQHYESCLARHGDTHLGVDWPKAGDVDVRYRVMLDVIRDKGPVSLLDFGSGAAHLYEYIARHRLKDIAYTGLDAARPFVDLSRQKHPGVTFLHVDVLDDGAALPDFDYVVMNGVFTIKREVPTADMFAYLRRVVEKVFPHARRGIAFNVMSKQVDWERDDLFHLGFDEAAAWLRQSVTKNYVFRADYGLYEYTVYAYH